MRYLWFLVNLLLLITFPTFQLFPHAEIYVKEVYHLPLQLSYDNILNLLDQLENGGLEKRCCVEELEKIDQFLVLLAKQGNYQNKDLEEDIDDLLEDNTYSCSFSFSSDKCLLTFASLSDTADIHLCKNWISKKWTCTKEFVKKHKTAIIIGAVIVVAATVVICVVVAASAANAAAATAALAGATAAQLSEDNLPSDEPDSKHIVETIDDTPNLKAALEENICAFREEIEEAYPDATYDASLRDKVREWGAILAHETLETVGDLTAIIPKLSEELHMIGDQIGKLLPEDLRDSNCLGSSSASEEYQKFITNGHEKIDRIFATDQADLFFPERNKLSDNYVIAELPFPGLPKGVNGVKLKEAFQAGQEAAVIAKDLGYSATEIAQLEKTGSLKKTVTSNIEDLITHQRSVAQSFETFKNAETILESYKGKYLSEIEVRGLIHQTGIKTFPRPNGIPENYRIKLSDKPGGMKYVHPENEGTYVRVMPGKPHSPFPNQREPYVNHRVNGKSVDKYGNIVDNKSPDAHIPLDEFIYRNK